MIISFIVRSGIVVGAVYFSRALGVWGDAKQSEKLYNQIQDGLRPHIQKAEKQLPFEVPALPQADELSFLGKHYYNKGVKSTFHFLEMLPCYTGQLVKKTQDKANEFMKQQQQKAK